MLGRGGVAIYMSIFKPLSLFLTPYDANIYTKMWRHYFQLRFWGISRDHTQKQMTPLESGDEIPSETSV